MKRVRRLSALILATLLSVSFFPAIVSANAPGPNLDGSFDSNPLIIIVFVIISLLGICFTCFVEWLVSGLFGLRDYYGKHIILTNIITQVVMRFIQLWIPSSVPEGIGLITWGALSVAALEILVFISECLVYCKIMRDVIRKRICLFTFVANMASAVGGILLLIIVL